MSDISAEQKMDIPDDILEAAKDCIPLGLALEAPEYLSDLRGSIASALLAERERCAVLCDNYILTSNNGDGGYHADEIAAQIRAKPSRETS